VVRTDHLPAKVVEAIAAVRGWHPITRLSWKPVVEIVLIFAWALWVGRVYLNPSVFYWPLGSDFSLQIMGHFTWDLLSQCGTCVFWNGMVNGGSPSFAEVQGAVLHPFVMVSTLIWGAIVGGKLTIIMGMFLAGLAQWWLARVMHLDFVPRMWAAAFAVVGGHLAGRMEIGLSTMVLSIGSASLVLAPALDLVLNRNRRAVFWLGVTLAFSLLAGQGYMQLALAVGVAPVFFLVFLLDEQMHVRPVWKQCLQGVGLAVLLAGVLLVPLLHFWPYFVKEADLNMNAAQSIQYMPLNLLIDQLDFYQTDLLGKVSAPFVYMMYIGWLPLILAAFSIRLAPREGRRLLIFFWAAILWLFLLCSREFLFFIQPLIPQVVFLRYPAMIPALAIPMLLGLAAWSMNVLFHKNWPSLELNWSGRRLLGFPLSWLIIIAPMVLSIHPVYLFSQAFYREVSWPLPGPILHHLRTPTAQWVMPPYGEFNWSPEMQRQGYKLTGLIRPWGWRERAIPGAYLEAVRMKPDDNVPDIVFNYSDIGIRQRLENEYAFVQGADNITPCSAQALGGKIDVTCDSPEDGMLIVRENAFPGWRVWIDGKIATLEPSDWLSTNSLTGKHVYSFRYQPWDVWLGLILTLFGCVYAAWIWKHSGTLADGSQHREEYLK
jgi:hypothetical protein